MSLRAAILAVAVVWGLGAVLFPFGGMIHFLLVVILILIVIDRVGRTP